LQTIGVVGHESVLNVSSDDAARSSVDWPSSSRICTSSRCRSPSIFCRALAIATISQFHR